MTDDTLFNELKKFALSQGISLFGVADTEAVSGTFSPMLRPLADVLPRAISLGVRISDSVLDDLVDCPTLLYLNVYKSANWILDQTAARLTTLIQEHGYHAAPIPASQIVDWTLQMGHLSHRLVAYHAGLGRIGRSTLLVTPEYGARVRLATILTDAPLSTGEPLKGDCGHCKACMVACPVEAITPEGYIKAKCLEKLKTFAKMQGIGRYICGLCVRACRGKKTVPLKGGI